MGCNGRDRLRRNNIRNIRLIKHNAERFGIPTSSLPELSLKPSSSASSDHHLGGSSDNNGDQNRNPNPNFDESGWGYCTEDQLEELLLKNLEFLYNEAMSRLITLGYEEEIALKAILRNGHCYGNMDVLSNIVQNSISYLSSNSVNSEEPESVFNDLRQLEEYSLTGMVCLLQQVRPHLSKGDAMWCLLMSDLHVGRASSMEIPVLPSSGNDGLVNGNGENGINNLNGLAPGNCKFHGGWGFGSGETCEFSISGSFQSSFDAMTVRDIECPKRFNLPPSLKSMLQRNVTMFAAGFRANAKPTAVRSFGGSAKEVTLEPEVSHEKSEGSKPRTKQTAIRTGGRLKEVTLEPDVSKEKPAGFKLRKNTALRTGPPAGVTLDPEVSIENSEGFKTNVRTHVIRSIGGSGMGVSLEPEDPPSKSELRVKAKPVAKRTPFPGRLALGVPLPDNLPEKPKEPQESQNSEVVNSVLSSLGNLTLDEKVEGGASDPKNEMILNLINQIKDLEGQVKERKEWAHQKAMQAARKLSQDLTELKMLRMEREETQRLKKGKQALEDTTMKRLHEMENALRTASGQVDRANAAVRRLETENAEIRAEMEASKLSASESVMTCLQVAKREKKCLKKLLAWEKQKSKLQEEVAEEKHKISLIQEQLVLMKETQKETEAKWRQELKSKEQAMTRMEEERRSKEATEISAKRKTETLRRKIELDFQRHKDDIQRLEHELSRLRASIESTTQTNSFSEIPKTPSEMLHELNQLEGTDKEGDYDRECIICMKDEVSVVFLPCAHQVMCASCSQDYGKKGRANCPCCRVQIEQRICVYGASS